MKIRVIVRRAALAALVGALLPAPASAQIGGLLKKKLKEKIVHTVVARDTTAEAPPADAPDGAEAQAPSVKKRAPGTAGPTFDEYNPEITPELLDRLEKLLAAQEAARTDVARRTARFLPEKAHHDCVSKLVVPGSPDYAAIAAELRAAAQKSSPEERQQALEAQGKHMQQLQEKRCGPNPIRQRDIRAAILDTAYKAALAGNGFTAQQYAVVLERLVPFCDAASGSASQLPAGVYSPLEVKTMQARCVRLAPALKRAASPWG